MRSYPRRWIPTLLLAVLAALTAVAGTAPAAADAGSLLAPELAELAVEPAVSPVEVDGHLDEAAWGDALRLELAYELIPGDSTPAPVRTEFLLTHDEDQLYFAFRAYDPDPASIRAYLTDRDSFPQNDYVGLVLDTFHDQRRAFEFEVNPLGVQSDYLRSEVTGGFADEDPTWDAIWASRGRITAEGYVVEGAIPFSSLRFPRTAGEQTWGITAYRIYPRNVLRVLSLVSTDRDDPCLLCQAATLRGMAGITPGRNVEIIPTATALRTDARQEPGSRLEEGEVDSEVGLTARWGITPGLSLGATVNPDFSQVEADAAQLDVNVRFALFFPEKRPFFLEGADAFTSPLQAIYTRTLADPAWGLKLSGKEGKNLIGVYAVEDESTSLLFPANQGSALTTLDLDSRAGVLRYRRDLGTSSTLGLIWTGREGEEYSNQVVGLDAFFSLSPSDTVTLQALESRTEYPDAVARDFGQPMGRFDGSALYARYEHNAEDWLVWAGYSALEPGFRADLGFIPRVDAATGEAGLKRVLRRPEGSWFTYLNFGLATSRTEFEGEGDLTDQAVALVSHWEGPLQSILDLRLGREKELFDGVTYDQTVGSFTFYTQPTGKLTLSLSGDFGDTVDFESSRAADLFRLGPGANFRLGRHVEVDLQHLRERLDVAGGRLYTADLSQLRLVYQLNVRTFVRTLLQYFQIDRDRELYLTPIEPDEERQETLFTQLLFSYKLNPQTVVFLGYSDNHFGQRGLDLTQTDRTFFVKLGYSWTL